VSGRRWALAAFLLASISLALSALLFSRVLSFTDDNSALTCSTARLVSYVPAVQFEGEPRSSFVGWIRSRHAMLVDVRERERCSEEVERLLARRVRLDERALRELE
jgi:hypothetical protein